MLLITATTVEYFPSIASEINEFLISLSYFSADMLLKKKGSKRELSRFTDSGLVQTELKILKITDFERRTPVGSSSGTVEGRGRERGRVEEDVAMDWRGEEGDTPSPTFDDALGRPPPMRLRGRSLSLSLSFSLSLSLSLSLKLWEYRNSALATSKPERLKGESDVSSLANRRIHAKLVSKIRLELVGSKVHSNSSISSLSMYSLRCPYKILKNT